MYAGIILCGLIVSIMMLCRRARMNNKQTMAALTMGLAVVYIYFRKSLSFVPLTAYDLFNKESIAIFVIGCVLVYVFKDRISKKARFVVLENEHPLDSGFDKQLKNKIETLLVRKGYLMGTFDKTNFYITYYYSIVPEDGADKDHRGSGSLQSAYRSGAFEIYARKGGYIWEDSLASSAAAAYTIQASEKGPLYKRTLMLKIVNTNSLKYGKREEIIWMGDVVNIGSSSGLQDNIDYLLVGLFKYFARETGPRVKTILSPANKEVKELREAAQ